MNDIQVGDILYFKNDIWWRNKWNKCVVTKKHLNYILSVKSVRSEPGVVDIKHVSMAFRLGLHNPVYIAEEV